MKENLLFIVSENGGNGRYLLKLWIFFHDSADVLFFFLI